MAEKVFEKVPFFDGLAGGKELDVPEGEEGAPPKVVIVDGDFEPRPASIDENLPDGAEFYVRRKDDDLRDWRYDAYIVGG